MEQRFLILIACLILLVGCSEIRQVTDIVTNPSARTIYGREFKDRPALFAEWERQEQLGMQDSVFISLPYTETGRFFTNSFPVYSYTAELQRGQVLYVDLSVDSLYTNFFLDLYRIKQDSIRELEKIKSADYGLGSLHQEIEESGLYVILVQPEISANTPFQLQIYRKPVYVFPVAGKQNADIHSPWGTVRDGGARTHEGIDIFAPRGTPVLATTEGRIGFTGNRGLGGKQVWLRDRKRGQSLYYAHLDSIAIAGRTLVAPGDTLGFVGNTGNARTTPPHLHFGIYKGFGGAIDPLHFIEKTKEPQEGTKNADFKRLLEVRSLSNLRSGPSTDYKILRKANAQDTLEFLGKTGNWIHARKDGSAFFIAESLVTPLEE